MAIPHSSLATEEMACYHTHKASHATRERTASLRSMCASGWYVYCRETLSNRNDLHRKPCDRRHDHTDEVAGEMAKQVGKVASHELIVGTDASFCDVMSGRYRGWAHLSTLNELDCPADAAGADSAPRKRKGWLDQALEASGTGQRTSLRRGREHASDRAHAPARRCSTWASRRPAGDAGEDRTSSNGFI